MGLLLLVATQLDTCERPVPDVLRGYAEAQMDVPVPVHVSYPRQLGGTPELVGQNGQFFGDHMLRNAAAPKGAHPVVVLVHGSGETHRAPAGSRCIWRGWA